MLHASVNGEASSSRPLDRKFSLSEFKASLSIKRTWVSVALVSELLIESL